MKTAALRTAAAFLALAAIRPFDSGLMALAQDRPAFDSGLTALAQDKPEKAERAGDTVSFELKSSIIFVKGTVNGTAELTFIVDTGASVTVVKPATAEKLGLTKKGEKPGALMLNFKVAASIGAGRALVKDLPVAVMGVPQADLPLSMQGITYDGILGYNYISQFVTTFDYKAKTIKLVPNDYVPEDPREELKKRMEALRRPVPADAPSAHAGFTYATIGDDVANEIGVEGGVVVKAVAPDSPAAKAGLRKGDVLQEAGGKRVDRAEDWQKVLAKAKPGDVVKLSLIREKKDVELELTLGERK